MNDDSKKVVVGLIKNKEGKYLMTRPSAEKNYGDLQDAWAFPAGHVKIGEDEKTAIIREIKEELDLNIEPVTLLSQQDFDIPGETAYWWECKQINNSNTVNISSEIAEYSWFAPEEIKKLKIWPAMKIFLTKYIWK